MRCPNYGMWNKAIDPMKAFLVITITLSLVVLLNLAIYYLATRRKYGGDIDRLRQASDHLRAPWAQEDRKLQELSRLVEDMKNQEPSKNAEDSDG